MDAALENLGASIKVGLAASVTGYEVARGELTLFAKAADIVRVATFLRDDAACHFNCIIDVTAIDWPGREQRFDVVYHLLSPKHNRRIRVKIAVAENAPVSSIIDVFRGAEWFEREAYDLYGILFTGHPD